MKKRILALMLAVTMTTALVACGSDKSADKKTASTEDKKEDKEEKAEEVVYSDYVTLGTYTGLNVEAERTTVTDEAVAEQVKTTLQSFVDNNGLASTEAITDRTDVQSGDIANINYAGSIDGTPFEGGTAEGYDLEIGSGSFIPGFEDGLIGKKVGDTFDLPITFPENYGSTDLAGKAAVFSVTVNSIAKKVDTVFDDALVAKIGSQDYSTMDEFTQYIKKSMEDTAENEYKTNCQDAIWTAVYDGSKVKDLEQSVIDKQADMYFSAMEDYMSAYGATMDDYYTQTQTTAEAFKEQIAKTSEVSLKNAYVMKTIAEKEKITVSEDEIQKKLKEEALAAGYTEETLADYVKATYLTEELFAEDMLWDKVMEFLLANNTVTQTVPAETPADADAAASDAVSTAESTAE